MPPLAVLSCISAHNNKNRVVENHCSLQEHEVFICNILLLYKSGSEMSVVI